MKILVGHRSNLAPFHWLHNVDILLQIITSQKSAILFALSQWLYSEGIFTPFTQEEPMNTKFQDLPNVVSPKEVQTYFGISRSTTYRIFHDATFPAFHIGNRLLVRRDELLNWLEQQKVNKAQSENPKIVGSDE